MVTFLRPHPHAHGPAAVNVRLCTSRHKPSPSLLPCRSSSSLTPMAQDPSHPHRQSKEDTAPTDAQQQPEQELTQQPPRDVLQEPSTSSSSSSDTSSWLQLGIGVSPGSPSPSSSRRKRPRSDYEAGPSTSIPPATPPPPPQLQLSLFTGSSSPSASAAGEVVAVAPPPAHEAGMWFVLQAAENQRREPPLPQIPKSYLRVSRDGRMTVRVVMSYLVNKLDLEDDSQVKGVSPSVTSWRLPMIKEMASLHAHGRAKRWSSCQMSGRKGPRVYILSMSDGKF